MLRQWRIVRGVKKELFEELKRSLREANRIKRGQLKPGRVFHVNPESTIVRVRGKLGLSQPKFAAGRCRRLA